jgi:predicted ATPase
VPVVVASLDPGRSLLAIEQPELHLHPRVACNLGDLFIDQIAAGKVFLIESHSEHLVLRLKRRIKEKKLRAEDISVLFVEAPRSGGRTIIIPLRLDADGEFMNEWPGGFFEEGFDEIFAKTR